jgi:hypothetical protein
MIATQMSYLRWQFEMLLAKMFILLNVSIFQATQRCQTSEWYVFIHMACILNIGPNSLLLNCTD